MKTEPLGYCRKRLCLPIGKELLCIFKFQGAVEASFIFLCFLSAFFWKSQPKGGFFTRRYTGRICPIHARQRKNVLL